MHAALCLHCENRSIQAHLEESNIEMIAGDRQAEMYAERLAPLSGKLASSDTQSALASAWDALAALQPDVAAAAPILASLDAMLPTAVSLPPACSCKESSARSLSAVDSLESSGRACVVHLKLLRFHFWCCSRLVILCSAHAHCRMSGILCGLLCGCLLAKQTSNVFD